MKSSLQYKSVSVNGKNVQCVVSESTNGAVPMVFRYGMYGTNSTYRPWMKASLASAPVQVVGIPTPGFGGCPQLGERWTLDNLVEFQQECLEQLGIDGPMILAAHSAGGPQQLAFASANKDRVAAIIAVNAIGNQPYVSPLDAMGIADWSAKVMLGLSGSMLSQGAMSMSVDAFQAASMHPMRVSDALAFWRDVDVVDVAADVGRARIPVVLARSKGDPIADKPQWEQLGYLTRATKVELGGSHMVGVDVPNDLAKVNDAFLDTAVRVARIMDKYPDVDRVRAFDSLSSHHEVLFRGRSEPPMSLSPMSLEL